MNQSKLLGIVLIVTSGIIYTLERIISTLSSSLTLAGFWAGNRTGEVPQVEVSGFFDNFYVPLLLISGIVLLIYGFMKK